MSELKFKYLNEIDISSSLTDSAHVIVEDGGSIKRAPMNQLVTGGGVSSWNDLTDKPFYEESFSIDIEWDGVIGDRPRVAAGSDPDGNALYLVHMSDEVISLEALNEMTMSMYQNGENSQIPLDGMAVEMGGLVLVGDGNVAVVPYDNFDFNGVFSFPKAGIYFAKLSESLYTSSLKGEATVVYKLDKKYVDNPVTLTVSYTYNNAEGGEYTDVSTDLGYAEVAEAYKTGYPIFVAEKIIDDSEKTVRCPATVVGDNYIEMLDTYATFSLVYTRLSDNQIVAIEISHPMIGEQTEMHNIPSSALPAPGYDGQILGVVDGAWSAMDAPSGLPEVTTENNGNVLTVVDGEWSVGQIEIPEVNYPVTSVNGQTGAVIIEIPEINYPVTSVNGQTGAVVIDIPEVNYPVTSVNGQTGEVIVEIPVTSVNGQTGAVSVEIPTKLSNPNAITFTGAVEATYDGSSAVSVEIPVAEKELPEATTDNNGAFLRIVDGAPTWVMLEIAEEGAY